MQEISSAQGEITGRYPNTAFIFSSLGKYGVFSFKRVDSMIGSSAIKNIINRAFSVPNLMMSGIKNEISSQAIHSKYKVCSNVSSTLNTVLWMRLALYINKKETIAPPNPRKIIKIYLLAITCVAVTGRAVQ